MIVRLEYLHRRQLFYGHKLRPWVLAYFEDFVFHACLPDGSHPLVTISNWDQVSDILPFAYYPDSVWLSTGKKRKTRPGLKAFYPNPVLSSSRELCRRPYFLSYYPYKLFAMFKNIAFKAASRIVSLLEFSDSPYLHTAIRVIILSLLRDAYQKGREDHMAEYIRDLDSEFH